MVLSALKNYVTTHPDIKEEGCFLWWCFFQNNQFRMLGSDESQSFDMLRTTFGTQLQNVGRMVSMLDQVVDSVYSRRLWCVFEVYVAAQEGIPMEVLLPEAAQTEIESLIIQNGGFKGARKAISVMAEEARASVQEDEEGIKALIERMPGKYTTLNDKVRESLANSLAAMIRKA